MLPDHLRAAAMTLVPADARTAFAAAEYTGRLLPDQPDPAVTGEM